MPSKWRGCCASGLSCSCHNLVGLTPSTIANECTIPVLQGWTPEEGLVAPGLQTQEVCRQALALLQLLRGEILIKAYFLALSLVEAWKAVCLAATEINSTSTALGLS